MIEHALSTFRAVLENHWSAVDALGRSARDPTLAGDWAQAMWESIVEGALQQEYTGIRLVVYGDGADVHGASSRYSFPQDLPTHEVRCAHDACDGCVFDRYARTTPYGCVEEPPFDCVVALLDGKEVLLPLEGITWSVVEVVPRQP
jgi:hypothetical protein